MVGHSFSYPGCLSAIITLTIPLEERVQQFREAFSHSVADIRSRLKLLAGQTEEVGEKTDILTQRADTVEKEVAEVQRQTSDLSERLDTSLTECERRQEAADQQAMSLELRTTLLESCAVTSNMEKMTEQMEEMQDRLELAESDAAKAKIASEDTQQNVENRARLADSDQSSLLERLMSLEKKFEASFPAAPVSASGKPLRSVSSP